MSLIESEKFILKLLEPSIISLEIKEGEVINGKDIHKIYAGYNQLVGENEFVVLVFANPFSSISKKASEIAAKEYPSDKRKKVAIVSDNLAQVMLVNFFIRINKPKTPTKVFKNESVALDWLRQ